MTEIGTGIKQLGLSADQDVVLSNRMWNKTVFSSCVVSSSDCKQHYQHKLIFKLLSYFNPVRLSYTL